MKATSTAARPNSFSPFPRYWMGGDPFASHFFNALSCSFPLGERAFVDSVLPYATLVENETQQKEVRLFLIQEANHSAAHRQFNRRLSEMGYPVDAMEAYLQRFIDLGKKAPPIQNLAVTVCFEHFTAILSAVVAGEKKWFARAPAEIAELWAWHAREEIEHQSVAFALYRRAGGARLRLWVTMLFVTILFSIEILGILALFLKKDGLVYRPSVWLKGSFYLWGFPGILRRIVPSYLSFFWPGFTP